jgi:uncharacterized membrane protein
MKGRKGFGVTEIAIIIVIVTIISFALLKSREMIEEAKLRKFETIVLKWKECAKDYINIKGSLPGDTNSNFIIGDEDAPLPGTELIQKSDFLNRPPPNPMAVGSLKFWVYYGNNGAKQRRKNVLAICADDSCTEVFTDRALKYVESFDAVIDGEADGMAGEVVALSAVTVAGSGDNRVVTRADEADIVGWSSNRGVALIHYIKKMFR